MPSSTTLPSVTLPDDAVQAGTLARPHGLRGELSVRATSGQPDRLEGLRQVWLVAAGQAPSRREVLSHRRHGELMLMTLRGITDRDESERWTGAELWCLRAELPVLEEGEFAAADIIGAWLIDVDKTIGPIRDLVSGAAHDYLEVQVGERRVLVPAVKDWLIELDVARGRVVMRLPDGLVEVS